MIFRFFEKLTEPFPNKKPVKPPKTLMAFCLHYCQGMWFALLMMSLLSAAVAILEVYLFGYLGTLVDAVAAGDPDRFFQQHQNSLYWMAALLVIGLPAVVVLQALFSHQSLLGNFPMRIRWSAHQYLIHQSLSFFYNDFAGRIATKVMQTALSVRETVLKMLDLMVYVSVYFVGIVILVMTMDINLAIPFVVWFAVYVLILRLFLPRLKRVSQQQADARSSMTGRIVDSYTNIQTVKLFSHSAQETEYARSSMDTFLKTVYPQMRLVTLLDGCIWLSNALLVFAVVAAGLFYWQQGSVTAGDIAVSVALAMRLNGMSQWIMWEISGLFENIGMVQDGMNTLSLPTEVKDIDAAKLLRVDNGAITFQQINFNYKGSSQQVPVFDALQLNIRAGEKVGIVGKSGAGKSTLVNLLLRFYDVDSGTILIDGQDISQVQQESLRANISMVTQDTSLLHRSIRENILYGKPEATEAELVTAAKQAEAHEFIQSLADQQGRSGYDAMVGERGVKLSGGQRQRIAIARVLLKDAPILILDEATSALDSEVEVAIQESLNKIMDNKTVLAIAHRLSTIAAMDRLIVLDKGKVVEMGSHQELLALNGQYARLWKHQTGGFLGLE
ncbi:ABC transporter ATP-binding protein [Planctobacterium marinum]|uniref:ABC transporter ATP-binding protein n=1 Tax=Planctobacterium marinum TaxID=1631968 RepID=A0AA48HK92_9ALTE|nr:ABC transporter ATP-binding protein [Planctobacterium marinum]